MGFRNPGSSNTGGSGVGSVFTVNGEVGDVLLDATDVGADPIGSAAAVANSTLPATQKGAVNGVATLDGTGNVPADQLGHAGAGGGAVNSVNKKTGVVNIDVADVIHGFTKIDPLLTSAVNAPSPLTIVTPDGTGQVVEPAVEFVPEGWNGHKWWACITGYAGSNANIENPAVYYSDDGSTFTPVPGVPFPLVPKPTGGTNADPNIVLGPDGTMHIFWITLGVPAGVQAVWWTSSTNGTTWTTPVVVFQGTAATDAPTGPTFVYDKPGNQWICHYVDAHNAALIYPLKRRTCPGTSPGGTWSSATVCTLTGVPGGRTPWENHVRIRGDQYHMVITFADLGTGGAATTLHFGVSEDKGLTWTFNPTPLLAASAGGWDNSQIYRADIVPMDDGGTGIYYLLYSALGTTNQWRMGRTVISAGIGAQGAPGAPGPPGSAGLNFPGLVASPNWAEALVRAPAPPGVNNLYGCRVICPTTGILRDIAVFVGVSSGNYRVGIYDTGSVGAPGVRTRRFASGIIPVGGSDGWRVIVDPGFDVIAGDELDLAINCDNGSVTLGNVAMVSAAMAQLPAGFIPLTGGAAPKMNWINSPGGFVMPVSVSEAGCVPNTLMFPLIARISAT